MVINHFGKLQTSKATDNYFACKIYKSTGLCKADFESRGFCFRGGTDIESAVIREFSLKDKLFSHAGVILEDKDSLFVFHILGGITNIGGSIIKQSIDSFINYPQNESIGIYSSELSKRQIDSLRQFMDSLIKKRVLFDIKFNHFTHETLYCTELLVNGINYCTQQQQKFNTTSYFVKNTKYHFLMNYKDSFQYYPIDQFQHDSLFTRKKHFCFLIFLKRSNSEYIGKDDYSIFKDEDQFNHSPGGTKFKTWPDL